MFFLGMVLSLDLCMIMGIFCINHIAGVEGKTGVNKVVGQKGKGVEGEACS